MPPETSRAGCEQPGSAGRRLSAPGFLRLQGLGMEMAWRVCLDT